MLRLWSRLSRVVKVVGAAGVILGAVASGAAAWPYVEPLWVASRGYVRGTCAPAGDHAVLVELQLAQTEEKIQRLIDEVPKRELELQSDQAKQFPEYHELVQRRLDRVKQELKTQQERENSLFKEKVGK